MNRDAIDRVRRMYCEAGVPSAWKMALADLCNALLAIDPPRSECTGQVVHDEFTPCPEHDAPPRRRDDDDYELGRAAMASEMLTKLRKFGFHLAAETMERDFRAPNNDPARDRRIASLDGSDVNEEPPRR